ncbi:MAG: transketolase [Clostridia bacterium]|nr:transketolase [Clostridia bacterium]
MYTNEELQKIATFVRRDIVEQVYNAKSGHPGGALSCTDILTALYFNVMNLDPKNPTWEDRDRFILSKGHSSPALYSVLARRGFYDVGSIKSFRKTGSVFQGHPALGKVPGVDMTNGSLGQGFSIANGMALAAKLDNKKYNVYVMLGDGELEEGQNWEAAMTAAHYKLNNVIAIVDNNGLQIDGKITEVKSPEPIADKFRAFGFNVYEIDGHNFDEIMEAFNRAKNSIDTPNVIIAKTTKGKGISFMEDNIGWHGKAPNDEEYNKALSELGGGNYGVN